MIVNETSSNLKENNLELRKMLFNVTCNLEQDFGIFGVLILAFQFGFRKLEEIEKKRKKQSSCLLSLLHRVLITGSEARIQITQLQTELSCPGTHK